MKNIVLLSVLVFVASCGLFKSEKEDGETGILSKKKRQPVNVSERVMSTETDGFFSSNSQKDTLGNQNVMWRATLNTLNFIPINTVDYDGGVIVTDWYSPKSSNESIKINVKFNSNEIKVSSFTVKAFKKTCSKELSCKTTSMNENFNKKIKNQILEEIKNLEIKSKKK